MHRITPKSSTLRPFAVTAIALGCALALPVNAQVRYHLETPEVFGTAIKRSDTRGNEINDAGETLLNRVGTFAIWKNGTVTEVVDASTDFPATLSRLQAGSINLLGQAIGVKTYQHDTEYGPQTLTFPFYWDAQKGMLDLDNLEIAHSSPSDATQLFAINDAGTAIGHRFINSDETAGSKLAFTWSLEEGTALIEALDEIDGQSVTIPQAIDNSGTVVGTYHSFTSSLDQYFERAFIHDSIHGSRDLVEIDADFFDAQHLSARDLNQFHAVIGERDQEAYLYRLDEKSGLVIPPSNETKSSIKALALNDFEIVVGLEIQQENSQQNAFIWSQTSGTRNLNELLGTSLPKALPEGHDQLEVRLTPKAINNAAQISASLESTNGFKREVVLQPVLDFSWNSMKPTNEHGIEGIVFTHDRTDLNGALPAAELGLEIGFECSSDMKNWRPLADSEQGVRITETEDSIELFLPLSGCVFVKPTLIAATE